MLYISYFEISEIYGHGKRLAIWFSGCNLKCKNCWNKKIQFKKNGTPYTVVDLTNKILTFANIKGVTFLGGEPLQQNIKDLLSLCKTIKKHKLDIVLLTGYDKNQLQASQKRIIKECSVVKYGPYIDAQRNTKLLLRGSNNQYIECYDKRFAKYYEEERRDVEIIIDEKEVKILGFPDDFID